MPKISVIIPVYNAEKYIEKCLDSIINQTLKDIEIICIDDCSQDNSLHILKKYSEKDGRIKVLHCDTNGGESKARNIGIDNTVGEYLAFVDNDDYLDLDFYEKLYSKAKETDADIVKGEARVYQINGKIEYENFNESIRKNNSKYFFINYWWTAIYKSELIKNNNIRLLENYKLGGDILFLNEAIIKCKNLELVDNVFYNYVRRADSGDSVILTQDKIQSALFIHGKIIDNTLLYVDDTAGKKYILQWCLQCAFYYAYRLRTEENLHFCIGKACYFYKKVKTYIKDELYFLPIVINFLENNDVEGLIKFYKNNNTQEKMIIANLRFLHMNRGKNAKNIGNNSST